MRNKDLNTRQPLAENKIFIPLPLKLSSNEVERCICGGDLSGLQWVLWKEALSSWTAIVCCTVPGGLVQTKLNLKIVSDRRKSESHWCFLNSSPGLLLLSLFKLNPGGARFFLSLHTLSSILKGEPVRKLFPEICQNYSLTIFFNYLYIYLFFGWVGC